MPDRKSHLNLAEKNQKTIDYLLEKLDEFPEWIATVSFYKALHLVEALFSQNSKVHSQSHDSRLQHLKKTPRYSNIYKHYRPLYTASMVARYMENKTKGSFFNFTDFLTPKKVKSELIDHRLRKIEQSVTKLLAPKK